MHILIIPSWYPGKEGNEGLFIREQIIALGKVENIQISILNWGPNEFVLKLRKPLDALITLIKFPFARASELTTQPNITEYKIPHLTWTSLVLNGNHPALISKLSKALPGIIKSKGSIDLIHAHVAFPAGFLAEKLSKKYDIPYIITEHSGPFPFHEYLNGNGIKSIVKSPLVNASAVIAVSKWLADSIKQHTGIPATVIPNSVNTDFFKPTELVKPHIVPVMFCLSQLSDAKGIGDLLQATHQLKAKGFVYALRIGGSGRQAQKFKKLAARLGLNEYMHWLGSLSRKQALCEYSSCDFYVMPSRMESLSMVILEALSCGKPIVATACGGPAELVNEQNGILAQPSKPVSLAAAIERMLITYKDYNPQAIRQQCIDNYSQDRILNKILSVYECLLHLCPSINYTE